MRSSTSTPPPVPALLVARKVRGLAAEHGANQQDIGDAIGLTRAAVGRRLSGKVDFTSTELQILAAYFGVPVSVLFGEVAA